MKNIHIAGIIFFTGLMVGAATPAKANTLDKFGIDSYSKLECSVEGSDEITLMDVTTFPDFISTTAQYYALEKIKVIEGRKVYSYKNRVTGEKMYLEPLEGEIMFRVNDTVYECKQ